MNSWAKNKFVTIMLFLIVVFQSGHALQTIIPSLTYLIFIPAFFAILYLAISINKLSIKDPQVIILLIFSAMIGGTMLTDLGHSPLAYVRIFCVVIGAFYIAKVYSFQDFTKCYLTTMTIVALIAVVGYFLVNYTSILSSLPKMNNANDVEYGVGVIFNYIVIIPERNCGMFWEPGLFATHLTIATVLELIMKEKASFFRLFLFSLGFITANSSAGFALWFLLIILFFIRKINTKLSVIPSIFSIMLLIIAIAIVLNFDNILAETALGQNEYFKKLSTDRVLDSSRIEAILFNWEIFLSNPIFGAGYTGVAESIADIHVGDTSTSLSMMSVFGILGLAYTGFIVYGILSNKELNVFSKIIILTVALIIINKEPHSSIYLTWILIFYLNKSKKKAIEKHSVQRNALPSLESNHEIERVL